MVAKGHDFPDVALGVVIDADQTLRFPDFRAEERTFALVTQLAGRIGRGAHGGRVLVQTLAPDARPIGFATQHDSDGFVADELIRREALGYPPFATLIRVVCAAEHEPLARSTAEAVAAELGELGDTVRHRCSGSATGPGASSSSRRRTAGAPSPPSAGRLSGSRPGRPSRAPA
jgi:primosomal protein N' (replication factor Y)